MPNLTPKEITDKLAPLGWEKIADDAPEGPWNWEGLFASLTLFDDDSIAAEGDLPTILQATAALGLSQPPFSDRAMNALKADLDSLQAEIEAGTVEQFSRQQVEQMVRCALEGARGAYRDWLYDSDYQIIYAARFWEALHRRLQGDGT